MNNVPLISSEGRVFSTSSGRLGMKKMLRINQRSVEWIMDLVSKFFQVIELVLYSCASTFSNGKGASVAARTLPVCFI